MTFFVVYTGVSYSVYYRQLNKAKIKFSTLFTRVTQDHTNHRSSHLPLQDSNDSFYTVIIIEKQC